MTTKECAARAAITLALALSSAGAQEGASLAEELLGTYERVPVENDWHKVTIELDAGGSLLWKNAAGKSWPLELREDAGLFSSAECPYGAQEISMMTGKDGLTATLKFNNETYRLVKRRMSIDEFWKEAIAGWRAGPVRELDEAEVDGTIQTFDSSAKVKLMFEEKRDTGETGYSITHRLIGAPNLLEAVHEVRWETTSDGTGPTSYRLTEVIYDFRSSPAKKHSRESKMKKHFFDMSGKPDSVSGPYSTQDLDAGAVSAVKEARSDWWVNGLK